MDTGSREENASNAKVARAFTMTQQPQPHPPPPSPPPRRRAKALSDGLMEVMTTLLDLIENETALVRAGQVREAMLLEPRKTDLSRSHVIAPSNSSRGATTTSRNRRRTCWRRCTVIMTCSAPCCRSTPHCAGNGARGVGRHHPRRQRRDAEEEHAADLGTGRRAAQHPSARHAAPLTINRTM